MPKSKRNKQVSLTKTRKKGLETKKHLVQEVRITYADILQVQNSVDNYARIVVFSIQNMRNSTLKDVREQWKHSRFFFGKNRVMARALGKGPEDEYRDNLHKVSERLKGQCGLLFTNRSKEEILRWFKAFRATEFARAGNVAEETVILDKGPIEKFSHALEPHLRQLGMPTSLQKGIVTLIKDYEVCKDGDVLTPEQAQILKLLGNHTVQFKMVVQCIWTNNGEFEEIVTQSSNVEQEEDDDDDDEEDEMSE